MVQFTCSTWKVTPSKYFINDINFENVNFYKDLGIIFEIKLL